MKVYVFGNPDTDLDNRVYKIVNKFSNLAEFVLVKPNEDLPFTEEKEVIILDTVQGISEVTEISEKDLDKLSKDRSVTVHDFDLGFQLRYLRKLGKLSKIRIIGIPQKGEVDYLRIQSIFKKLVAQDMQGS